MKDIKTSAFFFDLDGTIFEHGTDVLLQGAKKLLDRIEQIGGRIIFMTRCGDVEFQDSPYYSEKVNRKRLEKHGLGYYSILHDVPSPRIFLDDSFTARYGRLTNEGFTDQEIDHITGTLLEE